MLVRPLPPLLSLTSTKFLLLLVVLIYKFSWAFLSAPPLCSLSSSPYYSNISSFASKTSTRLAFFLASSSSFSSSFSSLVNVINNIDTSNDAALHGVPPPAARKVYDQICADHSRDIAYSLRTFASEDETIVDAPSSSFEWAISGHEIIRTGSSFPLLTRSEVRLLRSSAEKYWQEEQKHKNLPGSRFTLQRRGNSEVHLSSLPADVREIMDRVFRHKVYPLVRSAYGRNGILDDVAPGNLCVYDSIVVRYDARAAGPDGAGQPPHRDLGLVSINIALSDDDEYTGGGTAFESLLGGTTEAAVLRPRGGMGHGILHPCHLRHAGARTVAGVRTVLVAFLTAVPTASHGLPPRRMINARAKNNALKTNDPVVRTACHQIAVRAVPSDGEARGYLGMALLNEHIAAASDDALLSKLVAAIRSLERACSLCPYDGRQWNNLGTAYLRWIVDEEKLSKSPSSPMITPWQAEKGSSLEHLPSIIRDAIGDNWENGNDNLVDRCVGLCFGKAVTAHCVAETAGCDVRKDLEASSLNLGLWRANKDDFKGACDVLKVFSDKEEDEEGKNENDSKRIRDDGRKLYNFCIKMRNK